MELGARLFAAAVGAIEIAPPNAVAKTVSITATRRVRREPCTHSRNCSMADLLSERLREGKLPLYTRTREKSEIALRLPRED